MMNPVYHFNKMRELLGEYEPSRERSIAQTKIDEAELWLTRCTPTAEAVQRDGFGPPPGLLNATQERRPSREVGLVCDDGPEPDSARDALDAQSLQDSPGSDL